MGVTVTDRRRTAPRLVGAALLAAALAACGGEPGIEGRWSGEDADGNRMTFDFREGGDASWIVTVGGAPPETIDMRYSVDPSVSPHEIDLTDFEGGPLEGLTMVGIYEFTGDDAFRIDLEPVTVATEAETGRPTGFTDETVVFNRVSEGE